VQGYQQKTLDCLVGHIGPAEVVAGGSGKGPPARRVLCYRYRVRALATAIFAVVRVRECIVFSIAATVVITTKKIYNV